MGKSHAINCEHFQTHIPEKIYGGGAFFPDPHHPQFIISTWGLLFKIMFYPNTQNGLAHAVNTEIFASLVLGHN